MSVHHCHTYPMSAPPVTKVQTAPGMLLASSTDVTILNNNNKNHEVWTKAFICKFNSFINAVIAARIEYTSKVLSDTKTSSLHCTNVPMSGQTISSTTAQPEITGCGCQNTEIHLLIKFNTM